MHCLFLGLIVFGAVQDSSSTFRAGADSLRFSVEISDDERRGEAPASSIAEAKQRCSKLLEQLRQDGTGLKLDSERNIDSYFTVADAFEADGLLVQSLDYLTDLEAKLSELLRSRAGKPRPNSLIQTEDDILHFRDCHNVHVHDAKYLTGAQPTEKGYRWLQSKGLTTVINLRKPSDHERKLVESLGMTYVHIPWADERPPTVEQVREMLEAVKNSKGKVLQHCLRGVGRDLTMASCYLIATHGRNADELIQEGQKSAPRWATDQKRDPKTGEGVQFQLIRQFEQQWKLTGTK